jgi:hypothetical protein
VISLTDELMFFAKRKKANPQEKNTWGNEKCPWPIGRETRKWLY